MARFWLIFVGLSLLLGNDARAQSQGEAVVTARMQADGVHASVALDRAVTQFDFDEAAVVREGEFQLLTPGLSLAGNRVTAAKPFRRFELLIRPMTKERDARYPAHFRLGAGGVLYAPALKADSAAWRTRLSLKTGAGQVLAPSTGDISGGFVFMGPAALRSEGKQVVVIADPATPAWLVERTGTDMAAAVASFTDALGAPLGRKPLLIVKHMPGERNFNVGDVTPGAVTSLRFHGDAWAKPDPLAAKNIQGFVLHEAFHFWNGGLAKHAEEAPTWLHEGGAEYASMLGGLKAGVLDEADVRKRLSQALARCRSGLKNRGDKALAELETLPSDVRYPCGMVLQWAADLHLRRASAGKRTVMDAWAEVIRTARKRPSSEYRLTDFYAAAGIGSEGKALRPIELLVNQSGAARWAALPAALNALGAEVKQAPTMEGRRQALLFHLLKQNCRLGEGSSFGFYSDGGAIRLDGPKDCGALSGGPVLKSLEGSNPFEMTADTYSAVQRKCAVKAAVIATTADGRTLSAACGEPLADAPQDYAVERWMIPASPRGE